MPFLTLIKRNLLLFFKDKSAVFFSLMAVFVVLGLYICFLGDLMITPLEDSLGKGARELSDNWIMAGTLGTVALTTTMSALGLMIEDRSKSIVRDFYVSALKPLQIQAAYLVSAFCITMIIGAITLLLGQFYIVYYGGEWITVKALLSVFGVFALDTLTCGACLVFIMSFFRSASSFSNATTIVGTLSGFLMGIYIPVGALPQMLQTIIKCFPPTHGAALMRQFMMDDTIKRVFSGAPQAAITSFQNQFGLCFSFFDRTCSVSDSLIILLAAFLLFVSFLFLRARCRKNYH